MDIIDKLDKILEKKWALLQEKWEEIEERDENPYDKWEAMLMPLGYLNTISYETNWHPKNGIPSLVDALFEVINDNKPVYAIDFDSGINGMGEVLFFDRNKLQAALEIRSI